MPVTGGTRRRSIVVSGMIAAVPRQGGATWAVLQYVLGLRALGHHVSFVESVAPSAVAPTGATFAESLNASYFAQVMSEFELDTVSALLLAGTTETAGLSYAAVQTICGQADMLVNISGNLRDPCLAGRIPVRVYVDLDPGFTQFWAAVDGVDMTFSSHTHFVTIGQAIGQPGCPIPSCGVSWIPTLQPIALSHWPVAAGPASHGLTTIGHWRSYGSVTYEGVFYGQKAHAVRQVVKLPTLTGEPLTLAMAIDAGETADLAALHANGWRLLDPAQWTGDPSSYRRFIRASKAELGIAKSGYVLSRGGWFSDRSICYLASGRPVIAAETGFSRFLPSGAGLLAFENEAGVLACIDELNAGYARHARAARAIAEEYFDANKVLRVLLDRIDAA